MNWFFLQVTNPTSSVADSLSKVNNTSNASAPSMNLMDMLGNGGPLMIPLALLLVLAIFFFFERLIAIRKASNIDPNFMNIILSNYISTQGTCLEKICMLIFDN